MSNAPADQLQEFIIRVRQAGQSDIFVGRRYGEFAKLHKRLRTELPGKVLAPLPRKNKSSTTSSYLGFGVDDDASSVSSVSTQNTQATAMEETSSYRGLLGYGHSRSASRSSNRSPRNSSEGPRRKVVLYREDQRVSLRAFLRTFLQNEQIAESRAMHDFLKGRPVKLNQEELEDIQRRKDMDEKRIEEQRRFYEIARERARELDIYMERFRRDTVESSMSAILLEEETWTLMLRRWTYEAIQGDQRERKDCGSEYGVPEVRRMAALRVKHPPAFTMGSTHALTGLPPPSITFSLPRTIRRSCWPKPSEYTR